MSANLNLLDVRTDLGIDPLPLSMACDRVLCEESDWDDLERLKNDDAGEGCSRDDKSARKPNFPKQRGHFRRAPSQVLNKPGNGEAAPAYSGRAQSNFGHAPTAFLLPGSDTLTNTDANMHDVPRGPTRERNDGLLKWRSSRPGLLNPPLPLVLPASPLASQFPPLRARRDANPTAQ